MNCKFFKICKLSRDDSVTCTKNDGMYYSLNKPSSCYINNEKIQKLKYDIFKLSKSQLTNGTVHVSSIKLMLEQLEELTNES